MDLFVFSFLVMPKKKKRSNIPVTIRPFWICAL